MMRITHPQGQANSGTGLATLPEPIFQLRSVVKIYSTGAGDLSAINGIDLEVYPGEFLGIVGKSGAGKTTLLNLISGVTEITSGEVLFRSHSRPHPSERTAPVSVHSMHENEMAAWRGRNLGIVYQSFELIPQLNLVKNVMLPQDFLGTYRPRVSEEHALELLERVELLEHAYKLPAHTSGGQKQRVAIARALVNDPPVIIADEPTGNLDTVTADTILRIFEGLVDQGKTIILVTHDRSLAARFTRQVTLSDGEVVSSGTQRRRTTVREQRSGSSALAFSAATSQAADSVNGGEAGVGARSRRLGRATVGAAAEPTSVDSPEAAILLRDVTKTYVNAAGEFPALRGINLEIGYGQFVSLVGKSGCGKSTLLNMLTGIDHPTSGQVVVGGQDLSQMSESARALWRGRNVGIVFQFFQLLPTLTLLENTMLPMDYCSVYRASERPKRAMDLLAMVGLADHADKLPSSVSSGQQQSAAIARALATDPPIIVADEPTGNLDSVSAEAILRMFTGLAEQGRTILIVTHDASFANATDHTVILSDGEIVDDLVARVFPMLGHPQMLQATRQVERRVYQPGAVIIQQGQRVDHFYMIARGEVKVVRNDLGGPEIHLAQLGEGQFLGEIELLRGEQAVASVRAAGTMPVELSMLSKSSFQQMLESSPPTIEMVRRVANMRLRENQAHNGQGRA